MDLAYARKRLVDVGRGLRLSKQLAEQERWSRERLEAHQRKLVDDLVRHAAAESPFYRERLAGLVGKGPVDLTRLPTLDKATMMERFDDLVTDRRLRRDALLEHLDGLDHDALYLGHYRAMTTSGSSGGCSCTTGSAGPGSWPSSSATARRPGCGRACRVYAWASSRVARPRT